jgi:hypothetical protein
LWDISSASWERIGVVEAMFVCWVTDRPLGDDAMS